MDDEVEAWFLGRLSSVSEARRFVRETWADKLGIELVEAAVLLTSELVTNAVLHAKSKVQVRLSQFEHCLRVAVTDQGRGTPRLGCAEGTDEAGRGLTIVNEVATSWGITAAPPGGKTVWFTLQYTGHGTTEDLFRSRQRGAPPGRAPGHRMGDRRP